jgi:hypothetical protein
MPSLKVLVATARTQGHRDNDFTHVGSAELVDLAMTCDGDRGDPDGGCGCGRAFTGLDSRRCTTTAEVAIRDITLVQYCDVFHRSLVAIAIADDPDLRREAEEAAEEMARIAANWPVGTIVERRGDTIVVRAWPNQHPAARPIP